MPTSSTLRDRTRHHDAKRCAMTRKAARRAKLDRLFLCFADQTTSGWSIEMMSDVTFTVEYLYWIERREPDLLRDLDTGGKRWAVVRHSRNRKQVWSFHTTPTAAKAAARRWRSREIVTR